MISSVRHTSSTFSTILSSVLSVPELQNWFTASLLFATHILFSPRCSALVLAQVLSSEKNALALLRADQPFHRGMVPNGFFGLSFL
jgi:hypothetical protein